MKIVPLDEAEMDACTRAAQSQPVILTRKGKPVAMMVGVNGLDLEQLELGYSDKFWTLVREWRKQKTISQEEFERRLAELENQESRDTTQAAKRKQSRHHARAARR